MSFSQNEIEQHDYQESYYFCNVVRNVLSDQLPYLRSLNDFGGDERSVIFNESFPKWSHFHVFIGFVFDEIYSENLNFDNLEISLDEFKKYSAGFGEFSDDSIISFRHQSELFICHLNELGLSLESSTEDDLENFLIKFYDSVEFAKHRENTIKEIFYILFGNRLVMRQFNELIAGFREQDLDSCEHNENLVTKKGYLRRLAIPKWVQKAVYYRDKGRCVLCKKDVTGTVNIYNKTNYDHIVPLARYGVNDVSNIQLLCDTCNQGKKAKNNQTSKDYFPWYVI